MDSKWFWTLVCLSICSIACRIMFYCLILKLIRVYKDRIQKAAREAAREIALELERLWSSTESPASLRFPELVLQVHSRSLDYPVSLGPGRSTTIPAAPRDNAAASPAQPGFPVVTNPSSLSRSPLARPDPAVTLPPSTVALSFTLAAPPGELSARNRPRSASEPVLTLYSRASFASYSDSLYSEASFASPSDSLYSGASLASSSDSLLPTACSPPVDDFAQAEVPVPTEIYVPTVGAVPVAESVFVEEEIPISRVASVLGAATVENATSARNVVSASQAAPDPDDRQSQDFEDRE